MLCELTLTEVVGNSLVIREPIGVMACITPWNYPLTLIAAKVSPALGGDCTVVLKPSEVASLMAYLLADVIHEAGLPAGVFNLVPGFGPVVREALASHPEVDMVSFTGSTGTGRRVRERGAQTIKRVALELGGKSDAIILDDADYSSSRPGGTSGLLSQQRPDLLSADAHAGAEVTHGRGQADRGIGGCRYEQSQIGAVISALQRHRVQGYIRKSLEEGADLVVGGPDAPVGLDGIVQPVYRSLVSCAEVRWAAGRWR